MIRIAAKQEPRWYDFGRGVRMRVKPVSTTMFFAAEAHAQERAMQIAVADGLITDVGGRVEDLPADERLSWLSVAQVLLTQGLAELAVSEWSGVGDDAGNPAPLTPENIRAVIATEPDLARALRNILLGAANDVADEGNVSGAAPNGTGKTAAAPNTANPVETQKPLAADE